jgi:hypothetical protein
MRRSIAIFAAADAFRIATIDRTGEGTVVEVPVAADASPDARAAALADALKAGGFAGANAVLLLPSTRCLCATIPTDGLPARQRGQAMLYRFEERLPVAAEDIAADFIVGRGSALAVGVERPFVEPLVAAMCEVRVRLLAVCPASLLALQATIESRGIDAADHQWICCPGAPGALELIRLVGGQPAAWYVTSEDASDVALHVRGAAGGIAQKVTATGLTPELVERLKAAGLEIESDVGPSDMTRAATESAKAVLAGRRLPWINLTSDGRGAGAQGFAAMGVAAGRVVVAAVILFAACLACALLVRAARYERLAAGYEDEQREVYRRLFPDASVPVDVRSRLRSEARSATAGDAGAARSDANGLLVLRDVLTFLPVETRFRVSEMRLDGRGFTLEGDVPTHGDAEAVAGALRRRNGFEVQPPRTEQRGGVVAFTINGSAGKASLKRGDAAVAALVDREASR